MMFCQLGGAKSLREITEGLQAGEGKLIHLDLPEAPARSRATNSTMANRPSSVGVLRKATIRGASKNPETFL